MPLDGNPNMGPGGRPADVSDDDFDLHPEGQFNAEVTQAVYGAIGNDQGYKLLCRTDDRGGKTGSYLLNLRVEGTGKAAEIGARQAKRLCEVTGLIRNANDRWPPANRLLGKRFSITLTHTEARDGSGKVYCNAKGFGPALGDAAES